MAEAERDDFDLLVEVYLYIVEKRYSKECTAPRKRQIRKKQRSLEKFYPVIKNILRNFILGYKIGSKLFMS